MIVAEKINLADARAELGLSQQALAKAANVARQVIFNAENGLSIQRISAHRILRALNAARRDAGMPTLSITDIDWRIVGE